MFILSMFFFSSRRRHTRWTGDWSSDVCSSDLDPFKNCSMSTRIPCPTARNAVPIAAVVFPLPGPVFTMMSPRRTSFIVRESLIVTAGHVWRDTGGPRSPRVQTGWACKPNGCNVLPIWKNDVAKAPGLRNATQLRASQRTFIFCLHLGERYETSSQLGLERAGCVGGCAAHPRVSRQRPPGGTDRCSCHWFHQRHARCVLEDHHLSVDAAHARNLLVCD